MPHRLITLNEFIINDIRHYPTASGNLGSLLRDIALAAKRIHSQVNNVGLADILQGTTGTTNIQGEEIQKLDAFANELIIQTLHNSLNCCGISSEEEEDIIIFDNPFNWSGKYIVQFDPIDGSGNIDVSGALGTTFCIYKRLSPLKSPATLADFLQPGKNAVAAGYVLYGSSTILVYATERGTNGFTLDTSIGEFCLSHQHIQITPKKQILSVNVANYPHFSEPIQQYLDEAHKGTLGNNITTRYIGAMVADLHRNLLQGGIFLYPSTTDKPKGKLRLNYECNPLAYIVEKAGGEAINEKGERILDLIPTNIHERSTIYIGEKQMLHTLKSYLHL